MDKILGDYFFEVTGYFIEWGFTTICGHTDSRCTFLFHSLWRGVWEGNISLRSRYLLRWGFIETCEILVTNAPSLHYIIFILLIF